MPPRVVMAAGTMNSVKILFASQEAGGIAPIDRLGDCLGIWMPKSAHRNSRLESPIHGRLKTPDHPDAVKLIIGGVDAVPVPAWAPKWVEERMANMAKRRFQLIAMGVDPANGSVSFNEGRLKLEYDLNDSEVYHTAFDMFDRLSRLTGARVKFDRKSAVTAHAMGGCRIGPSSSEGVVDGAGEIFGNAGLYVVDASVLPAATGGPPSLSIAAWSSHVASSLLSKI
jgi:cholesterol oxidase